MDWYNYSMLPCSILPQPYNSLQFKPEHKEINSNIFFGGSRKKIWENVHIVKKLVANLAGS